MRGVWCARVVLRAAACRVHVLSVFRVVHSGVRTHIYTRYSATSITHTAGSRTMRYYRLHVFDLCSLLKNQNGTGERHTIGTPQYTHTTQHAHVSRHC